MLIVLLYGFVGLCDGLGSDEVERYAPASNTRRLSHMFRAPTLLHMEKSRALKAQQAHGVAECASHRKSGAHYSWPFSMFPNLLPPNPIQEGRPLCIQSKEFLRTYLSGAFILYSLYSCCFPDRRFLEAASLRTFEVAAVERFRWGRAEGEEVVWKVVVSRQ